MMFLPTYPNVVKLAALAQLHDRDPHLSGKLALATVLRELHAGR